MRCPASLRLSIASSRTVSSSAMTEVYVKWRVTRLHVSLCRGMGQAVLRPALVGLVLITGVVARLTSQQLLYPRVPTVAHRQSRHARYLRAVDTSSAPAVLSVQAGSADAAWGLFRRVAVEARQLVLPMRVAVIIVKAREELLE